MSKSARSIILWVLSFFLAAGTLYYQRKTGPTYPVNGKALIENQYLKYSLPRASDAGGDEVIRLEAPQQDLTGTIRLKRYKSNDEWTETSLRREGTALVASIPHQPPAGKIIYQITISAPSGNIALTDDPVVLRFRGAVPLFVVIPHVIFMLLSVFFSFRAGFEAFFKGKSTFTLSWITMVSLAIGGLILGPLMQKYAFGAFWTGWPFGHDLTDNKTAFALIFWVIAFIRLLRNREKRGWALVASIVLLIVYLIPHSVLGSELDYTKP